MHISPMQFDMYLAYLMEYVSQQQAVMQTTRWGERPVRTRWPRRRPALPERKMFHVVNWVVVQIPAGVYPPPLQITGLLTNNARGKQGSPSNANFAGRRSSNVSFGAMEQGERKKRGHTAVVKMVQTVPPKTRLERSIPMAKMRMGRGIAPARKRR